MDGHPSRIEAERLLGVAEKLLFNHDLNGSRELALLAQETEPLLEGSDQILAVIDVLLAAERRVNNHHDWYAILQIDHRTDDQELIKRQYRRLALLLHPDKNKFPFADNAFRFVAASWAVLSDPSKKNIFDRELSFFSRIDLSPAVTQQVKLPVRRTSPSGGAFAEVARVQTENRPPTPPPQPPEEPSVGENAGGDRSRSTFWTTCPYCYYLHEYPGMYENCCLRCQECQKAFHGVSITSPPPPQVPGKDAYHFCWGAFPLGFVVTKTEPKVVPKTPAARDKSGSAKKQKKTAGSGSGARRPAAAAPAPGPNGPKKRGRPRKYA